MNELKPCTRCGGKGEFHYEYAPMVSGEWYNALGVQCTICKARTLCYVGRYADDSCDQHKETVVDLWNRGRTARWEDG